MFFSLLCFIPFLLAQFNNAIEASWSLVSKQTIAIDEKNGKTKKKRNRFMRKYLPAQQKINWIESVCCGRMCQIDYVVNWRRKDYTWREWRANKITRVKESEMEADANRRVGLYLKWNSLIRYDSKLEYFFFWFAANFLCIKNMREKTDWINCSLKLSRNCIQLIGSFCGCRTVEQLNNCIELEQFQVTRRCDECCINYGID